jgi:hypothetical protein
MKGTEKNLAPLRSAIGMMECWNIGVLDLGNWGNGKKVFSHRKY